jgi:hypothetical protein
MTRIAFALAALAALALGWLARRHREPPSRWWLLWSLYGLPRCSMNPDAALAGGPYVHHCSQIIWPWQERRLHDGVPIHLACLYDPDDSVQGDSGLVERLR